MDFNEFIKAHWDTPLKDVAEATGLSLDAVKKRRQRMKERGEQVVEPVQDIGLDVAQYREKVASSSLKKKNSVYIGRISDLEEELEAMLQLKKHHERFVIKPYHPVESEAVAVALLSDTHVEELVNKNMVGGKNEYTPDIAKHRMGQFFARVKKLVEKERQDVTIKTLIIGILGDLISGNIHDELLENCALRPVEAAMFAQDLIQGGLDYLLKETDLDIVVVCKVGNHGRITHKVHISTEAGNNLEWFVYGALRARFQDNKRIKFVIEEGYHTILQVFDYKLRFHHGHNVKYGGGVGGITIPLNKAIHQWNLNEKCDWDFIGHFHEYINMHRFVVNGSMIGYNAFAVAIKAEYQPPIQAFCLIDRKRGKTVSIPILFDEEK